MKGVARFGAVFLCLLTWSTTITGSQRISVISDYGTADHNLEGSNFLKSLKGSNDSQQQQCQEVNGFLSCSSNLLGHMFLIVVYEFLLYHGESFAGADGRIFDYLGNNFVCLFVFQIIDSLPISLILLGASGVLTGEETPQEYVEMGAGIVAGSSIFLLTVLWGLCLICGRTTYETSHGLENKWIQLLNGSGIVTDDETRYLAKVMSFSLVPFAVILLPRLIFGLAYSSQGYKIVILVSLCVSGICLFAYFIHQLWDERILKRRQEYVEVEREVNLHVSFHQVQTLMLDSEKHLMIRKKEMKQIMTGPNASKAMTRDEFFNTIQAWLDRTRELMEYPKLLDKSGTDYNQVEKLVLEDKKKLLHIVSVMLTHPIGKDLLKPGGSRDESIIDRVFDRIDTNDDGLISKYDLKDFLELVSFMDSLINDENIEIMVRHLDVNGDGNIDKNEFRSGIMKLIKEIDNGVASSSEKKLQPVDNRETDEHNQHKSKETSTEKFKVVILLLVGIVMQVMVAGPLVESVRKLSESINLKAFYFSFIIIPIATNLRTSVATIHVARKKTDRTTNVTFSEVYRKVFMNNIMGFNVLFSVIYFRGLIWNFSIAFYAMVSVCLSMGLFAKNRSKFPLWTLLVAFSCYPTALRTVFYYYEW